MIPSNRRIPGNVLRGLAAGTMLCASTSVAAAELMVCYATPDSTSLGPIFLQEPLRCAAAHSNEEKGSFVDMPRGLAELYEKGWRLIQVLERRDGDGPQFLAYVERR